MCKITDIFIARHAQKTGRMNLEFLANANDSIYKTLSTKDEFGERRKEKTEDTNNKADKVHIFGCLSRLNNRAAVVHSAAV